MNDSFVDTYHHVITHIQADYADERDSVHLLAIVEKVALYLKKHSLRLQHVLADGGFGSGLNGPATSVHRLHGLVSTYNRIRPGFIKIPFSFSSYRFLY